MFAAACRVQAVQKAAPHMEVQISQVTVFDKMRRLFSKTSGCNLPLGFCCLGGLPIDGRHLGCMSKPTANL